MRLQAWQNRSTRSKKRLPQRKRFADSRNFHFDISKSNTLQAKENADDLVAKKKEIDAQVEAKRKQAKEHEAAMRVKASTAGNIVGKAVPVSNTEVSHPPVYFSEFSSPRTIS